VEKAFFRYCLGGWVGVFVLLIASYCPAQNLREYQTPYYIIHTDLQGDDLREAKVRMTRMFETYRARTQNFSGQIDKRFEFYLYRNKDDYLKAGGPQGSAGVFSGSVLMATAAGDADKAWPIIQHEGFHQFAKSVIRGEMPTWLNEGIAVYFQDSLFTGDTYYTGLISPGRLGRLQAALKGNRLKSFKDLTSMSRDQWVRRLVPENYDQAWSIVHYLVHGENNRYQKPFSDYIDALGKGQPSAKAWQQARLPDLKVLEPQWRKWLSSLPPDPTANQYTEAYAQTFATYLARAAGQHQRFRNFDVFARAARAGMVRTASGKDGGENDPWLPPRVVSDYVEAGMKSGVKWAIQETSTGYWVSGSSLDGVRVKATVDLRSGEPAKVVKEPSPGEGTDR
jgi:hypothetical protein